MKPFFNILLIFCSVFLISCEKEYAIPDPSEPIDVPHEEDPYKPETNLPKEIKIYGKYTFTRNNNSFQFESEDQDWYCYKMKTYSYPSDEDLVSIRFRLYNKDNKLLHERMPFTNNNGREFIVEFEEKIKEYPEEIKVNTAKVWTYVPYHKDGVKIKAVLVDDTGKDLKALAERGILPPEEFRQRFFYQDCYRQVGFGIE
ncbi:MAG: hypothetical protein OXJ52_04225 [Oligoflexia bacterium]|nr:hypothetical protein [Oligoflexia bacterium]